jgi:hypothetical protein
LNVFLRCVFRNAQRFVRVGHEHPVKG